MATYCMAGSRSSRTEPRAATACDPRVRPRALAAANRGPARPRRSTGLWPVRLPPLHRRWPPGVTCRDADVGVGILHRRPQRRPALARTECSQGLDDFCSDQGDLALGRSDWPIPKRVARRPWERDSMLHLAAGGGGNLLVGRDESRHEHRFWGAGCGITFRHAAARQPIPPSNPISRASDTICPKYL